MDDDRYNPLTREWQVYGYWLLPALAAQVVPALFARKLRHDTLRAWVLNCATGEVAYAAAHMLYEATKQYEGAPHVKIFATDHNARGIEIARGGAYPASLAFLFPPEWLSAFSYHDHQYRILAPVRNLITFAHHQLLLDPPFARLDLIVCPTVWATFTQDVQEQLLYLFHWSLRPQGYLLLNTTEAEPYLAGLFVPVRGSPGVVQRDPLAAVPRLPTGQASLGGTPGESPQSVNLLLQSLNQDLRHKVIELAQANDDLTNLMGATGLAIIFIDSLLQVTRFTPQAQDLFYLLPGDRGRPLAHIRHTLDYPQLLDDAAVVFASLQASAREVQNKDGHWYLAQLRPYRTLSERINGVVLTFVDITERKQAEAALQYANQVLEARVDERTAALKAANDALQAEVRQRQQVEAQRAVLLQQLITTQEDERQRIARELHDQLGQSVSALGLGLGLLATQTQGSPHHQHVGRLQTILVQLDSDTRRLATELRPTLLDDLGLIEAVQTHVEGWAQLAGIQAEFAASGLSEGRLPYQLENVLYRVIQEALTNVLKHAQANTVSVILERLGDQVQAIIEDDGQGFDPVARALAAGQQRLGLLGMRERVALVGGNLTIETAQGAGTTLFVRIPINGA